MYNSEFQKQLYENILISIECDEGAFVAPLNVLLVSIAEKFSISHIITYHSPFGIITFKS